MRPTLAALLLGFTAFASAQVFKSSGGYSVWMPGTPAKRSGVVDERTRAVTHVEILSKDNKNYLASWTKLPPGEKGGMPMLKATVIGIMRSQQSCKATKIKEGKRYGAISFEAWITGVNPQNVPFKGRVLGVYKNKTLYQFLYSYTGAPNQVNENRFFNSIKF